MDVPYGARIPLTIECPKGSRYRVTLDHDGLPVRIRLLPDTQRYPFNYGFVPDTLAEDGDALDAILIGNRRVSAGKCVFGVLVGGLRFHDRRGEDSKLLLTRWRPGPSDFPSDELLSRWEDRARRFFAAYKPPGEAPEVGARVPAPVAETWLAAARARVHAQ